MNSHFWKLRGCFTALHSPPELSTGDPGGKKAGGCLLLQQLLDGSRSCAVGSLLEWRAIISWPAVSLSPTLAHPLSPDPRVTVIPAVTRIVNIFFPHGQGNEQTLTCKESEAAAGSWQKSAWSCTEWGCGAGSLPAVSLSKAGGGRSNVSPVEYKSEG